jgi:arylformamidase
LRIYDVSQKVSPRIAVWPGDTPFSVKYVMRIDEGMSCNVSTVTMSVHTGTHTDAPYHFVEGGKKIAEVPIEKYVGRATVVHVKSKDAVRPGDLAGLDLSKVERLLFRTADRLDYEHWKDDFAYLTEDAARLIASQRLALVGIDTPSVDFSASKTLTAHKILLTAEVAILEGLDLSEVPEGNYELIALPLRIEGVDSSPVRAILREL